MLVSIPIIMMGVTVFILIAGVVLMALGNKFNITHGTKLMCLRVISQAIVVVLIAVLYFLQRKM